MKECPIQWIAAAAAGDTYGGQKCIGDKCAWWVDYEKGLDTHHCGLIGRVWGRDDREG